MKRFLYTLFFFFITQGIALGADSAEQIYAKAYSALYNGNTNTAEAHLQRGITVYPDCAFLYAGMGDIYRKNGNYSKAIEYYTLAQQKKYSRDSYKIDFYSTKLAQAGADINSSVNSLASASKIADNQTIYKNINLIMNEKYIQTSLIPEFYLNTSDAELNNVNALKNSGQKDAALKGYLRILANNPKNFQAANNAGAVLIELKDFQLAQKYLEQAASITSNSAIVYNNLAIAYLNLKKTTETDNAFSQALKIKSDYTPAIINRAIAKIQADIYFYQPQNAQTILDIIKADNENIYAKRTLAKIYFLKGDYNSANALLSPLASNYNSKLYTQKAYTSFKACDYSAALGSINKAIALYSDNAADYEIRGRIYDALGRYADAKADFRTAIQKNPKAQNVYYYYARTLNKSGDTQGAMNNMRTFISLKKGNPQTSFLRILFE